MYGVLKQEYSLYFKWMLKRPQLIALGKEIRRRREALGLSQDNMAYEHGFSRTYYSAVERGEHNVTFINLLRIAKALKAPLSELIQKIEKPFLK